jgi:hypothetical protein
VALDLEQQIAELTSMSTTQLRRKYAEVLGEDTRSNNQPYLFLERWPGGKIWAHQSPDPVRKWEACCFCVVKHKSTRAGFGFAGIRSAGS